MVLGCFEAGLLNGEATFIPINRRFFRATFVHGRYIKKLQVFQVPHTADDLARAHSLETKEEADEPRSLELAGFSFVKLLRKGEKAEEQLIKSNED